MSTVSVPGLAEEVRKYGTFDANACLSCGSCTVACNLSNGAASFPRKQIQLALLGLRQPLLGSLEPWLCHDCGDCSLACPRQAEPCQSMMTLRRFLAASYDATGISSKILTSRVNEVVALLSMFALTFGLVLLYHLYYVELKLGDFVSTPMGLEHMFGTIIYFTYAVFIIAVLILLSKVIRMYMLTMRGTDNKIPARLYSYEIKTFLAHFLSQKNMRKCTERSHRKRWFRHLLVGVAFAAKCFIVVFLLRWFQTDNIYPLYNPQRWVGYLIAAILIVFPLEIIINRIRKKEEIYKCSEFSDFVLPGMLLLVAVSGIMVHIFRYIEFSLASHFAYAVHVAIAVSLVLVELPFGKLSHVVFRPLALYFQAVKERALAESQTPAEVKPAGESVLKGTQPV